MPTNYFKFKCFVIGNPRSATSQTGHIIASHIDLNNNYGIERFFDYWKKNQSASKSDILKRAHDLYKFYDVIKELVSLEKTLTYVRNFYYSQPQTVIVRTYRKNKLKQAISVCLAQQTNYWQKNEDTQEQNKYINYIKNLNPINVNEIKKWISVLNQQEDILNFELKNKKHITIEYEKFYFNDDEYKTNILNKIFHEMNLQPDFNKEMLNRFTNGRLNTNEVYQMIPNIDEIDKNFSNDKNGFLF